MTNIAEVNRSTFSYVNENSVAECSSVYSCINVKATCTTCETDAAKSGFGAAGNSNCTDFQPVSLTCTRKEITETDLSFVDDLDHLEVVDLVNPDENFLVYSGLDIDQTSYSDTTEQLSGQVPCVTGSSATSDFDEDQLSALTLSAVKNHFELSDNINLQEISSLYQSMFRKIIVKYFLCRTKQFIKATKSEIQLMKEKAHRKKIAQKSEKQTLKSSKLSLDNICSDNSTDKKDSHNILVGNITKNKSFLKIYTIPELHHLLRAYDIKANKNTMKEILIEKLTTLLEGHTLHGMPRPDVFMLPQTQNTSAVPMEE